MSVLPLKLGVMHLYHHSLLEYFEQCREILINTIERCQLSITKPTGTFV